MRWTWSLIPYLITFPLDTIAATQRDQPPSWPELGPPFYALRPGVSGIGSIDTIRLRGMVDEFMARDMAELRVPGAVVAMVQDGRVILLRGYGIADSATGALVDPSTTLFRLGSVTKPVTALAALQLVEQGRLDLHRDVNEYLTAFQIPAKFERPITAHHLLTHTAGIDVRLHGTAASAENEVQPLGRYLASNLP
jgi:CubicO group peptidase (beta-lactamase class C family)